MEIKLEKMLTPTKNELELIKQIDEIYEFGLGEEFETLVRNSIDRDKKQGSISGFDTKGTYYALRSSELPGEDRHDIFRRLCIKSPCDPLNVETPDGKKVTAQLVEKSDFQRIIRALMRVIQKLFGFGAEKTTKGPRPRDDSDENTFR